MEDGGVGSGNDDRALVVIEDGPSGRRNFVPMKSMFCSLCSTAPNGLSQFEYPVPAGAVN
jgi:hypothetical protein